jgi:hypothetical protein
LPRLRSADGAYRTPPGANYFCPPGAGISRNKLKGRPVSAAMHNKSRLFSLAAVLFWVAALFGADHPNFSGKWKLNVDKSDMGTTGVTALIVDVSHKDPVITYTVRGTAGGQDFEQTETFTTDGKPSRDSQGANVTSHWEGAALVGQGTGDDGTVLYTLRLTLSEDGKSITRVFTQKDDPQPRHEIYEKQ